MCAVRLQKLYKRISRWWNHLYAIVNGYFWTTCPLCGECFGGHENPGALWTNVYPLFSARYPEKPMWWSGESVCNKCTGTANRLNEVFKANQVMEGKVRLSKFIESMTAKVQP